MNYPKANHYDKNLVKDRIMGPNPIKLEEELLRECKLPAGSVVMDLGCGKGLTSVFLAKEYGFRVFAPDLWIKPTENQRFFERMGITRERIVPLYADANALPFAEAFFDGVVSVDSYNFFGRDPEWLDKRLLPFVKRGGWLYIAIPGMHKDCHDALPPELLLSWTPEQLDYIHDVAWWERILRQSRDAVLVSVREMESNDECWADWLACDNEYAIGDRKSMAAGAGKYLNFIEIVLRKK